MTDVKAWQENVTIPTYGTGEPEKLPMFLEKRVYQGSSGAVYPHPIIESIEDVREEREWTALFIENRYIRVMILPELGGRIQMAYDKIRKRHFIYYNRVIKPALVGLLGPWISGGIEFNWPQHHRPSTYQPVDFRIEENPDGSKTVWLSEQERMSRTKGMAGIRLYPDRAFIEVNVRLYNPTPLPKTFLWWANPAVPVNDHYQSVFPPDVHAVYDHGKRDVSTFPIATGTYYKQDYSAGVDISWYKNIPVPTSFMAVHSRYDFIGGYDHQKRGGLLHVADHHISPGKKQWTWGCGDFGRAWDRNLTDEDGPYIELMCGVFTDNQPDFSWLAPYEEKRFSQYFMPYGEAGRVKNATREALLNLEQEGGQWHIRVHVTSEFPAALVQLFLRNSAVHEEQVDLSPERPYHATIPSAAEHPVGDWTVRVVSAEGRILVEYTPETVAGKAVPDPAKPVEEPGRIPTAEQLYLSGLHLEQYRHATVDPAAYYREALKREPGHILCNDALGKWYLERGRPEKAEGHFRRAVRTLTDRNPNPLSGEPHYHLGLCLKIQGDHREARDHFHKAAWNEELKSRSYLQLALIDCLEARYADGLDLAGRALEHNRHNHTARCLMTTLLRKNGRIRQALDFADESLEMDHFMFPLLIERYLITGKRHHLQEFTELARDHVHTYLECALHFASGGFWTEAAGVLDVYLSDRPASYPMAHYLKGWILLQSGEKEKAGDAFRTGSAMPPDYCFPNRIEESLALQEASVVDPSDAKAPYYLGNYWYAHKQVDRATECWERSAGLDPSFGITRRNLAVAAFNKLGRREEALTRMERAFELHPSPRMLMELDQLRKRLRHPVKDRLVKLHSHPRLVNSRDDLYLERVSLLNLTGSHKDALLLLSGRKFHPWEGGEGKVTGQYVTANLCLAREAIRSGATEKAYRFIQASKHYPEHLGEGKLAGNTENDIHYLEGILYELKGDPARAKQCWERASLGPSDPFIPAFYNDHPPDQIYYQGLALRKLGMEEEALSRFESLRKFGTENLAANGEMDFFAVSYPDMQIWEEDTARIRRAWCHYLAGLGYWGLGERDASRESLELAVKTEPTLTGAVIHFKETGNDQ